MGYTHYWEFKKNPVKIKDGALKFQQAVTMLKKGVEGITTADGESVKLCGGLGEGEPVFSDTLVWLNGDASMEQDYETCLIELDSPNDYKYNFCKTGRRPYDVAVCLALFCFKHYFGDDFKFSSDGDIAEG